MFYKSEPMLKILLTLCSFGVLPWPTHQVPVGPGYSLLLYPGSVLGSSKPPGVLIPVVTSEHNIQQLSGPQTDHGRISPLGVYKPYGLNTSGAFLQPVVGSAPEPTPDPQTFPLESLALRGQMSNFLSLNIPMQVYSVVQQAVIADSDSSEEGKMAQVIYLIPVSVESSNMGVMEGTVPNPDPGHLHIQTTSSSPTVTPVARPEAQRQLGELVGPEMVTERPYSGKRLIDPKHSRGMQPDLSVKHKSLSPAGNTRQ
ncbi:uncharacterized protein si:ch211-149b19.4 isoform X2 [Triplophysa dalaica]|uniref:uncharacterized protein si:ch211-149b19.4 isoform X2 n=1 Tax=Triplophysa dalaica TaxID=1582913 RepID=UPI0024DF6752|nr:uncharacterized protein si:ch211-149b19.4 isoform X2 [Triplophysa dalaica]XP_056589785.1 uncharacterized protein si:ch211-149b19.4 isoform X2 [Triplophysa dalaica]XP_056589786.1 uncharacterized protein si:ch211-149b19.4 isoform X2 [Triplophysa dalaica]